MALKTADYIQIEVDWICKEEDRFVPELLSSGVFGNTFDSVSCLTNVDFAVPVEAIYPLAVYAFDVLCFLYM